MKFNENYNLYKNIIFKILWVKFCANFEGLKQQKLTKSWLKIVE